MLHIHGWRTYAPDPSINPSVATAAARTGPDTPMHQYSCRNRLQPSSTKKLLIPLAGGKKKGLTAGGGTIIKTHTRQLLCSLESTELKQKVATPGMAMKIPLRFSSFDPRNQP